jgi:spermidine synthase
MSANARGSRLIAPSILVVFAFSGCAGLIYQSVWTQYLGLFLGHAAYAQSIVLAMFMGGMALGSWWAGSRAMHWKNLLRAYAIIELFIGIAAAIFHPVFLGATHFAYDHAFPALGAGGAESFKWTLAAVLILPQSVLLGATFPLLSNALIRRLSAGEGSILSGLYFSNSIGAAAGALLATFVLVPAIGLPGAMTFGAVLNVLVALFTFLLSRDFEPVPRAVPALASGVPDTRLLLAAAFVTGATSFAYEIGWVRMLSLAIGSTLHAFELMLAAFIGGLACGGLWIRKRIDTCGEPVRVGGFVQVLMGMAALASLVLYDHLFDWVSWLLQALARSAPGYSLYNAATAVLALSIMAPAAFFAGMTLPLFTLALIRRGGGESAVGRIYAANTIGAIAGVFITMHVLLPSLGLKLSMIVAAAGDLLVGLVLLRRTVGERVAGYFATLAACGISLALTLLLARFDPLAMAQGVYRTGEARFDASAARVAFYRDGKTASVAIVRRSNELVSIATNGKVDASIQLDDKLETSPDEVTMAMAAVVPLAMHPNPQSVAVIGFGSGLTTHTLLGDARLRSVDTIEIEPAMFEGAKAFGKRVHRAYEDPRSHVRFDDAKAYFAANQSQYDIIVSEPSNPWVSGVASLFSTEFYEFVPRHLKPGGLLVQWVQQYELTDELTATLVRSLARSFGDFRVYFTSNSDMLIVASVDGHLPDLHEEVLRQEGLQSGLERIGIRSLADINVREIGDRRSLLPLLDAVSIRVNSDFYPILSLEAPRSRFMLSQSHLLLDLGTADLPVREVVSHMPAPDARSVTANKHYTATTMLHEGLEIAAALGEGTPYSGIAARDVATVRLNIGMCKDNGDGSVGFLIYLAGKTIPYLSSEQLQNVWLTPRWITCTSQSDLVRATLEMLQALARRDFARAGPAATQLLQKHREALSPIVQDWLLRAAMLSAIAQGDYDHVRELDESLGQTIAQTPASVWQRAYMIALARDRAKAPGAAQGR